MVTTDPHFTPDEDNAAQSTKVPHLALYEANHVNALSAGAALTLVSSVLGILPLACIAAYDAIVGLPQHEAPRSGFDLFFFAGVMLMVCIAVALLGTLIGWWWLTSKPAPEPHDPRPSASRTWVRALLLIQLLITLAVIVIPVALLFLVPTSSDSNDLFVPMFGASILVMYAAWLLAILVQVAFFFTSMNYLRWLSLRMPNMPLRKTIGIAMWALPILGTVGACVFFIGPVIVIVFYWSILYRVWRSLAAVSRSMEPAPAS